MNPILHPYVATAFLTSFVTFGVGIFVFIKNRKSPVHQSFLWFSLAIWQWSFFTALEGIQTSYSWALFLGRFCHIGVMLIPVFFYYFTLKITGRVKRWTLRIGFFGATLFIISIFLFPQFISHMANDMGPNFFIQAGPLYFLVILFFAFFVGLALWHLACEIYASRGARKKHLEYYFLASILGFGIGVFNFFPVYRVLVPPYPYSAACGAIYSCVIAYAILKHQLFDIEVMAMKGIVFGILFLVVNLGVSGFIFLASYLVAGPLPILSPISIALAMLIYEPLRDILIKLTNRFLFQKKMNYLVLIHNLTDKLSKTRDVQTLSSEIVNFLIGELGLEWTGLYLKENIDSDFILSSSKGANTADFLKRDSWIAALARDLKKPLILSPFDVVSDIEPELKAKLRENRVEAIVPIFLESCLFGILLLGKKKSDDAFSGEDEALLQTLMEEMTMLFLSAKLLKELTRSQLKLAQCVKMTGVTRLARGVHHEVRNPLHAIAISATSMLEACKTGRFQALTPEDLDFIISRQSLLFLRDIARITDSLNRFSQFARPEEDIEIDSFSLKQKVKKFFELMQDGHSLDHIKVHVEIPDSIHVLTSENSIQQILYYLFNNSYDAMRGKGEIFVKLKGVTNGIAEISFRDNGSGIPKEIMKNIFDPFFTTKIDSESAGLGLCIAKFHLERIGASIEVVPRLEVGAEFIIRLRNAVQIEERACA